MSFDRLILLIGALTAFVGTAVAPIIIQIIESRTKRSAKEDTPPLPQFGMAVDAHSDRERVDELADRYLASLERQLVDKDAEIADLEARLERANTELARRNSDTF